MKPKKIKKLLKWIESNSLPCPQADVCGTKTNYVSTCCLLEMIEDLYSEKAIYE